MRRRFVFIGLALAVVAGFSLAPVEAKGRCRATLAGTHTCQLTATDGISRTIVILDRQCRFEGRVCSQDGAECTTLYRTVDCPQPPDGDPGVVEIGLGCFCGGGSITAGRQEDPVSAEQFLRIQDALESEGGDAATCEAPASLLPEEAE